LQLVAQQKGIDQLELCISLFGQGVLVDGLPKIDYFVKLLCGSHCCTRHTQFLPQGGAAF
jgi:hypothetical protein